MSAPSEQPPILFFARDAANLCTLAGLVCGIAGIFFGARGNASPALWALTGAFLFDSIDGEVARRTPGRTPLHGTYGIQIDSLVDVVCACVCPGVILMGLTGFSAAFFPIAALLAAAGALRLAYFNVFGLVSGARFVGLPVDKNILALTTLGLCQPYVSGELFARLFGGAMVALALLNISSLRIPKQRGAAYVAMLLFALGLSVVYGIRTVVR